MKTARRTWLEGWDGPPGDETDIRRVVLAYAILAPNPHNKQPWTIELTGARSFDLYVDRSRLLRESDPYFRLIHIGQGTFLENLALAARHHGYRADITYFPRGSYANEVVEDKPVASILLVENPTLERDPLFDHISSRCSNGRKYQDQRLSLRQFQGLQGAVVGEGLTLTVADAAPLRDRLADVLTRAMQIDTADDARVAETLAMFRVNDDELAERRDGFAIAQSGTNGPMKWLAETFFLSRARLAKGSVFADTAIQMARDQAHSAAAFGWIVSERNERLDQVLAGRAYERVNLTATALGIAMHPMSQVLQEYPDMASLQREFLELLRIPEGRTVQMLFRMGNAAPVLHTARRQLRDLIRSSTLATEWRPNRQHHKEP